MIGTLTRVGALRRFVQCALWCTFGALVCLGGRPAFAATYTWNVTSGLWTDNLSWAPTTSASGTGPVAADTVVYAGAASQTINLGGATQTASILTTNALSATSLTLTATNGSLVLSGNAQQNFYATSASSGSLTYDFSGLSGFSYNAPTRTFNIGWDVGTATGTTTFNFATQGSGTNTITAQTFQTAGPNNTNVLGLSVINLGKVNTINSSTFSIGGYSNSGTVAFGSGVTNGSLVLRGTAGGTARVDNIYVGQSAAGAGSNRSGSGWLNLAGGSLDARATTTTVGGAIVNNQSIASTGVLTLASGTLDTLTLVVGSKSNVGSPALTATINQNGGLVLSGTVRFGDIPTAGSAAPTFTSTYNLTSGTLSAAVITTQPSLAITATTTANAASIRRIAWSGGTITHYDASTDLTISGTSTNAGYTMQIVLGGAGTTETFSADTGRTITVDTGAVISGTGNLVKAGAGTLTLTGSSTYAGDTLVSAGTLALGANLSLQNSVLDTSGAGSVVLNAGVTAPTLGGLKGATNLATEIASGYASVTGVTLNVGSGTSVTYSGAIADGAAGMTLTKTGTSTQVLTGVNTYTGATTVNSGTLSVTTLANGNAASGIGQSSNAAANLVLGGGVLVLENSSSASSTDRLFTLTGNGLIYNNNATAANTLAFTSSGTVAQSGAGARVMNLGGSNTGTNTFAPVLTDNGASAVSFRKQNAGLWSITGTANTYTGATTLAGGTLLVAKLANGGSASSIGASGSAAANLVFNGGSLVYVGGGDTTDRSFTITSAPTINASGSGALTWNGSAPTFSSGNTAYAITLRGTSTAANAFGTPLADNGSGAISVSKLDAGLWVLSGSNTYTGATTVSAGTLQVGSTNALGASTASLAVNAGTLDLAGYSPTVGLLTGSSGATITTTTGTSTLTAGSATSGTYGGTVTGAVGIVKQGTGTLTLTATNTFTQGLTIGANAGTVAANVFIGTGTSALGSGTASVGAGSTLLLLNTVTSNTTVSVTNPLVGSGTVQLNFAAGTTARNTSMTGLSGFSGTLILSATGGTTGDKLNSGAGFGTLGTALVIQPGTTLLAAAGGSSTFTNGITLSGTGNSEGFGAIRFGNNAALGGPVSLAADSTIASSGTNASLTGNVSTTGTTTLTFGASGATQGATFSGSLGDGTGRLALTKTQSGTLTLTGANTYTGTTSIQGGAVSIGSGGATGSIAGDVAVSSGASLIFNRTGALTYAGNVGGAGAVTVLGGGTVTLGGTNSYGGGTTVSAGRLVGTTSSLQGAITNNATVEFAQATSGTYSGSMSGASGALVQTGPGTLTLAAVNSYGGNTTVGGGTLAIGASQALSGGLVLGAASGATTVGAVDLTTASGTFGSLTVQTFTSNTNVITIGSGQTLATNGNVTIGATPTTSGTFATNVVVAGANAGVGRWSITNSQASGAFVAGVNTAGSGSANSVTVDLSSLGTFTANLSGASSVFRVGNPSGNNAAGAPASLTLAVSSTITAKTVGVGSASGESQTFSLYLGSGAQRLNTDSLIVGNGSSRAGGQLLFAGPTGSLVLRGTNGTGRTDVTMQSGNSTTGSLPTATIDVRGHDADLLIGTLAMTALTGNAGNAYTSTFSFDQGTLDVTTLTMGSKSSTAAGAATNTATINLGSSTNAAVNTSTIGSISMASHSGTSSTIRAVLTIAGANTTVTATGSWLVASNFAASGAGVSSGTVNVSGGTVNANQGIVLRSGSGFGTVDGTLNLTGGVLTSGGDITSAGTFGGGSATLTLNGGRLDMGGFAIGGAGQTVTANFQSGTLSNLGEFNNGAVLTKSSASALTLSGSSGYTGGTTVSGSGKLVAAGANALGTGTVTLQSARADTTTTFELSGGIAVTNPLVIDVTTGRNNLGGTGAAVNTIAGPITVSGNSSNVTIFQPTTAGGSLNVTGAITAASYTSALSFRGVGSTSGTLAGAVTAAGADVAVDSSGRWTVTSTGNTWAVTRIYSSGTWVVGANDALATGARLAFGSTTTGGVDLNGFNQAVAGLDSTFAGIGTVTNSSASANSVLTLAGLAANSTYRGIVADGPTRNVGLVMNSAGRTQTLSGANTYTGSTIITAGTLALGAGGSISSSPLIKVAGGATYDVSAVAGYALAGGQTLGGVGTVLGDVTVAGGATLSPGNSPGTLLQTGNQTWGGGGNYNWQLYDSGSTAIAGTGWDFLSVAGALSITASGSNPFNVNLWTLSGINPDVNGFANNFDGSADYAWDFATFSGGISGFNPTAFSIVTSATNGTGGFLNNDATGAFSVRLKPGDSNTLQIVYAAVPEPTGFALAGIGTGLAAWLVRRRRARKAG